jgi:small subunit ribosomal protein S19
MSRSLKKGPYVDERVTKKLIGKNPADRVVIKTWSRACTITPDMLGFTFGVHNGKDFISVHVTEEMVGHRLGEFSPTRKFIRHGGKMQKDLESAAKQRELDAAKAAKASSVAKKK